MIEDWVRETIKRKAKRMGIRGADLDDAMQDAVLAVYCNFEFNPARGTRRAAIEKTVENLLKMHLRGQKRYRRMLERAPGQQVETVPERQAEIAIDVQEVLDSLEPEDRELCESLAAGHRGNEIAAARRCHHSRIQRQIDRIRELFRKRGLEAWLGA